MVQTYLWGWIGNRNVSTEGESQRSVQRVMSGRIGCKYRKLNSKESLSYKDLRGREVNQW